MTTDLESRIFVRRGNGLYPADMHADELFSTFKDGEEVLVRVWKPRNIKHHRKLFALLRLVCHNSDGKWQDEEELLDAIKLGTGLSQPRQRLDGTIYRVPRSIAFASMGQAAFDRFYKRAVYLMGQILGVDPETLLEETKDA